MNMPTTIKYKLVDGLREKLENFSYIIYPFLIQQWRRLVHSLLNILLIRENKS